MPKSKILAMIPARIGSQRLRFKNLALLNNKPLISYAIESAIKSKIFDKIIINSDSKIFNKISKRYNIDFYHRKKKLGSSSTRSDDVVYDIIQNFQDFDYIFWINPISPLINYKDILGSYKHMIKTKSDSMISSTFRQIHVRFKKKNINFSFKNKFDLTQDLEPIELFNYAIMAWRSKIFLNQFKKKNYGFFCGKFTTFKISFEKSLIVKTANDLMLIENIINQKKNQKIKYDRLLKIHEKD